MTAQQLIEAIDELELRIVSLPLSSDADYLRNQATIRLDMLNAWLVDVREGDRKPKSMVPDGYYKMKEQRDVSEKVIRDVLEYIRCDDGTTPCDVFAACIESLIVDNTHYQDG